MSATLPWIPLSGDSRWDTLDLAKGRRPELEQPWEGGLGRRASRMVSVDRILSGGHEGVEGCKDHTQFWNHVERKLVMSVAKIRKLEEEEF